MRFARLFSLVCTWCQLHFNYPYLTENTNRLGQYHLDLDRQQLVIHYELPIQLTEPVPEPDVKDRF